MRNPGPTGPPPSRVHPVWWRSATSSWPPRVGAPAPWARGWTVAACGVREGERWVMLTRRGVVSLLPWACVPR
jgi:hypothetical protein